KSASSFASIQPVAQSAGLLVASSLVASFSVPFSGQGKNMKFGSIVLSSTIHHSAFMDCSALSCFAWPKASLALRYFRCFMHSALATNNSLQTDKVAVSHLLRRAQKLRHNNFAAEQGR